MLLRAILVCGNLLVNGAAHADWQFTKWGMSPEEVVTASGGKAGRTDPLAIAVKGSPEIRMPYRSGDIEFEAGFYFNNGRLIEVALELKDVALTEALFQALLFHYGQPARQYGDRIVAQKIWFRGRDSITLQLLEGSAAVSYSPQTARNAEGL